MKRLSIRRTCIWFLIVYCSLAFTHFQDAKKDAALISLGASVCKGGLIQMAVKNMSATKKIDVLIIKKETGGGITTTSTSKYSGLPPGYKQILGCGGQSEKGDQTVIFTIGSAVYSN